MQHHTCRTDGGGVCLFDTIDDPQELHNLAERRERMGQHMMLVLQSMQGRLAALNLANTFLDWKRDIRGNAQAGGAQSNAMCASGKRHGGYVAPPSAKEQQLDLDLPRGGLHSRGRRRQEQRKRVLAHPQRVSEETTA